MSAPDPRPRETQESRPREFTIEMPPGLKLLSLNGRYHWSERSRRTAALKKAAWALALHQKIPPLGPVRIEVEFEPPDNRRRDADNAATASGKPCIDGLVAAGVLPDDSPQYVRYVTYRVGQTFAPKGRIVLVITELTGGES